MTSTSHLKNHYIPILCYLNKGVRSTRIVHRKRNISLRTIYYNVNKLKQINSLKHPGENGRSSVLGETDKKSSWPIYST